MAIFKCKMCGGSLNITNNATIYECEYCATQQTLPKMDNEETLNMINRANQLRQQCEFDKAIDIYEKLITINTDDAELYWSLVLCRYGIEYVNDITTNKRIPTCHRMQYKSILNDADYLEAVKYADHTQKAIFDSEAKYIDKIQKEILMISNNEEPFDIFICYKESDENGNRTIDSVLAQELYYQLENEGFKVFFSRITLENKLGTEYEPYIFAALNSSKIMIVIGTKPEYFNSTWVQNEWSRYLMIMNNNKDRVIIPAYKDMNPYDLPCSLSLFQAQDMSKLGFMQDLIHGIKKIIKTDFNSKVITEKNITKVKNPNITSLLKRASLFIEDKDWKSAKEYCNRILDINPECAEAYLYLLMSKLHVQNLQSLQSQKHQNGISNDENYKKVMRFANNEIRTNLQTLNNHTIYNYAVDVLDKAQTEVEFILAANVFESIKEFEDSNEKIQKCKQEAEIARKDKIYIDARDTLQKSSICEDLEIAIQNFESIKEYKDSKKCIEYCQKKIEDIKIKMEKECEELEQELKCESIKVTLLSITVIIILLIIILTIKFAIN